jgi:predicted XRE-type DNA-binding protein
MAQVNKPTDVFKHIDMTATEIRPGMSTPCWPWKGGLSKSGRPYFTINKKKILAYRLVYELMTGQELGDKVARHKCDWEICCRGDHIEPGDHQDNMNDMKERERHGLPHHAIRAIRKLAAAGTMTQQEIANLYGIGRSTVSEIVSGVHYAHVSEDEQS